MTQEEFSTRFLSTFNPQQVQAVQAVDGPVLLLAVPGSGKTTVLVTRLGYMVCCCGIRPESILTMTYTRAATGEMRQRFSSLFGDFYARQMEFRTINGLSSKIIEYYSNHFGRSEPFQLMDNEGEISRLISQIYQELTHEFPTESTLKDIRTAITYIKNMMLTEEEVRQTDFNIRNMPKIYRAYCDTFRRQRLMDYDDQMIYALTFLQKCPAVLEHFQDQFRYICVDESQDTSKIQHEIIRLLAQKNQNIFMVGDEDQSIYGFRAAYPQALMGFEQVYPGAKILLMEKNYRSARPIIRAADAFVARNTDRHPKSMEAVRSEDTPIRIIQTVSREAQYQYLFALAQKCDRETAVLYRNNDSSLPLIDMLERNQVPYNCRNFDGAFFSHRIIQDITDILHFAQDPTDEEAFLRIYYKLGCPITRKSAQYACAHSRTSKRSLLDELVNDPEMRPFTRDLVCELRHTLPRLLEVSAEQAVDSIWNELRYGEYVEKNNLDTGKCAILSMIGRNEPDAAGLLRRLDELQQITQNHQNLPDTRFTLSTVHSSKGLEYERVFLLDVFDGVLPATPAVQRDEEDFMLYQEDRRLYYVAMTRAKDELNLFTCPLLPSEFTGEVQSRLPRPVFDDHDLFAFLWQNCCGRNFTHCTKGKGRIAAQCGDEFLVEYEDRSLDLLSAADLLQVRSTAVQYEKPRTSAKAKKAVVPVKSTSPVTQVWVGSTIVHKIFGKGLVARIDGDIASIRFGNGSETRQLSLHACLEKGLISLIS